MTHRKTQLESSAIPPEGLWDECSEWVWLPLSYGEDATRVKRKAYIGVDLPFSPAREAFLEYEPIEVGRAFIRPGEADEHGWAGPGPDTWYRCGADHPKAVEAWVVNFGG